MRFLFAGLIFLFLFLPGGQAQDDDAADYPGVDQGRVDQAIQKGVDWLIKTNYEAITDLGKGKRITELVLFTLLHAKFDTSRKEFQEPLERILKAPLDRTYHVALHAMLLSDLDAEKYQWRIAQCAQFLVDNQCDNGQWTYGEPVELPKRPVFTPPSQPRKKVASGGSSGKHSTGTRVEKRKKPKKNIRIERQQTGGKTGDNSNSQYAALGLRACMEANVWPPRETIAEAKKWWETSQNKDGGWGYYPGHEIAESYGSMTWGSIGSIVIFSYYLKEDWKKNKSIIKGIEWTNENFGVKDNPKSKWNGGRWFHYYGLYALERAGILTGLVKFGQNDWYKEGANYILDAQSGGGSWDDGTALGHRTVRDTCFAILFLRRATRPMVSSQDTRFRKGENK